MSKIVAFLKNESGATAIEYGLIAAGISVAIIAIVNTIGSTLNTKFTSISSQLKSSALRTVGQSRRRRRLFSLLAVLAHRMDRERGQPAVPDTVNPS
jgi:pilus assembly protein Flp/PilA